MKTISFKIDTVLFEILEQNANEHNGLSANTLARKIIIDDLNDEKFESINSAIASIEKQVQKLHRDLISCVYVLLLKAGKVESVDEAMAWIKANMAGEIIEGE